MEQQTFVNSIYRAWVPKWLAIIWHMVLFVPLMSLGSVYSACTGDTVGALQIWSEDFTFASLCAMIGIGVMAPFFYKIACIRRHRLMFFWGFSLLILLSAASARVDEPVLLGLYSLLMGAIRFVLIVANFAALARLLLGVDFRQMLGPQGDAKSTAEWDDTEQKKSMMIPVANIFFMSVGQLGTWLTAWFAYNYHWHDVYSFMIGLLVVLTIILIVLEPHRDWSQTDESATSPDDTPIAPNGRFPVTFFYFGNCTAASLCWSAAAYVFVYGKTLNWFDSPRICWACVAFVAFLVANIVIDLQRSEDKRYFRYEIWKYRNVRLATVLYAIAMVINTSSALTSAVSSVALKLDTYLNNIILCWGPLGFVAGALTVIVLRKKGAAYKWVFAAGFLLYGLTMWITYTHSQMQVTYEAMRRITIIRNWALFVLYCICMVYAYQRLPYRLMPSWIHIMLISRSAMGPAIGAAVYGGGMQYFQNYFTHSLAAGSDNMRMVQLQSLFLSVKEMAGYTLWFCIIISVILVIMPWPKRKLKPAEVPNDKP